MDTKTGKDYVDSIRKRKINLYLFGEKVENPVNHPVVKPAVNSVAVTYDIANDPRYEDLATVTSHITGEKINRFTHIHQSTDDLVRKVKLQRLLGQKTGACFQRCVGMDALNSLSCVTFEMDQKLGTEYYPRFIEFLRHIQMNDLICCGAMTDPKGDRSLKPCQQADPDLYLRIVEKGSGGIVVRGCKLHQTGAANSHEVIVLPTRSLNKEEQDYAVSFAIPSETKGLTYIYGRQSCDLRRFEASDIDLGNARYGGQETMIVFDDVFVPWERVFMAGEFQFAGPIVSIFSAYHRQSYGGCKPGVGDVLIGAAATMADYNGVKEASHIMDKLVEMNHLNETIYACGLACSKEGKRMSSGTFLPDILLSNICKLNVTIFPFEMIRLAVDIAGGLVATLPSKKDFEHPEIRKYMNKYLQGRKGVPTESRIRMLRLIESLSLGLAATGYQIESMHGAGSPQAQRIMIKREVDIESKKNLAKFLAGIFE